MGGDQQVHGSNRCAFLFKSRTEPAIGRCGFSIKRGDIERGDKLIEGDAILRGVPALACPVLEFRHGDVGDSDVTNWMCEEAFEYGGRVLLDEVCRYWYPALASCERPLPLLDGGLPTTLFHEVCRELLQAVRERRP